MPVTVETQLFLDKAYLLVAASLREVLQHLLQANDSEMSKLRELAKELEIPVSDSRYIASEREEIVRRVTLLPIAQECVVAMLRAIFEQSVSGTSRFHRQQLRELSHNISSHSEFSRNLGLSTHDAELVLAQTSAAFLSDDLFASPTKLAVDDDTYVVRREADQLIVQREAEAESHR